MKRRPENGAHEAPRCGAKTRAGTPCRRYRLKRRSRCRLHGGKNPIKHGLRSEDVKTFGPPVRLLERIAALEGDPKLLELKHIGAHLYAVTEDLLSALGDDEQRVDPELSQRLVPVLRELRRTATDYRRLQLDERFVDVIEARQMIAVGLEAVLRYVSEDARASAVRDFRRAVGLTPDETDATG